MNKILIILIFLFSISYSYSEWESVKGMNGGTIQTIYQHEGDLYATIFTFYSDIETKIYKSSDNGLSWDLFVALPVKSSWSRLLFKDKSIYLGLNTNNSREHGLYYSSDNGKSWVEKHIDSKLTHIIFFVKEYDNIIYVGTGFGVYKSTDQGNSWIKFPDNVKNNITYWPQNFYFINEKFFGIDALKGLYISSDNGENWSDLYLGNIYISDITEYNGALYASSSDGIFRSSDYGNRWTPSGLNGHSTYQFYVYKDLFYAATNKGFFVSENNGLSWNRFSSNIIKSFTIKDDTIYAGTNSGVYKSNINSANWIFSSEGINSIRANSLIELNDTTLLTSTQFNGLFYSTDKGNNWAEFEFDPILSTLQSVNLINNSIYVTSRDGIFVSEDMGEKWISLNSGLPSTIVEKLFYRDNTLYCNNLAGGLYYYENGGWNLLNNSIRPFYIYSFLTDDGNIYLGADNLGVHISSDNGESFKPSNKGFPSMTINIRALIKYQDSILAATSAGLYIYKDKDDLWNKIYPENEYSNVRDIAIIDSSLIIIADATILISKDRGNNWVDISSNLKGKFLTNLTIIDNTLFAMTYQAGIYKKSLKEIDSIFTAYNTETYDYLYAKPPYPLPASKEVRSLIYWSSDKNFDLANVSIYDIRGFKLKDVRLNLDKTSNFSGYLIWDCAGVESGIYIIHLRHGTENRIIKAIVTR